MHTAGQYAPHERPEWVRRLNPNGKVTSRLADTRCVLPLPGKSLGCFITDRGLLWDVHEMQLVVGRIMYPVWEPLPSRWRFLCVRQVPILCLRHGDSIHSAYESTVVNELLEVRQIDILQVSVVLPSSHCSHMAMQLIRSSGRGRPQQQARHINVDVIPGQLP